MPDIVIAGLTEIRKRIFEGRTPSEEKVRTKEKGEWRGEVGKEGNDGKGKFERRGSMRGGSLKGGKRWEGEV